MVALGARLTVRSAGGERPVAAGDFFLSSMTTVLRPDELLTEIALPPWPARRIAIINGVSGGGECQGHPERLHGLPCSIDPRDRGLESGSMVCEESVEPPCKERFIEQSAEAATRRLGREDVAEIAAGAGRLRGHPGPHE